MDSDRIIAEVMSRSPRKILTKKENYALYEAGLFGNKALTWNSYQEILDGGWKGGICMRSKKGIDRKEVVYNAPLEKIPEHMENWKWLGISKEMISFNQSMPDENLVLQGEVLREGKLFCLLYSTIKMPMNVALREESKEILGFRAAKILKQNLAENSYADLDKLLTEFPQSVVEFSAYSIPVGNLADTGRNTVFWEVRNY